MRLREQVGRRTRNLQLPVLELSVVWLNHGSLLSQEKAFSRDAHVTHRSCPSGFRVDRVRLSEIEDAAETEPASDALLSLRMSAAPAATMTSPFNVPFMPQPRPSLRRGLE